MVIDGYADFVRLQAFLQALSKHAAARSKFVAVVVARMEPQSAEISARGDVKL